MEEEITTTKKRVRDDSDEFDVVTPESKRVCSKSPVTESLSSATGAEIGLTQISNISIPEDILDILGDSETMPEIQDLDSLIRSFEEEILHSSSSTTQQTVAGESLPELGYLLEASDDELGLPPAGSEEAREETHHMKTANNVEDVSIHDIEGFGNGLVSYDSFEFGVGEGDSNKAGEVNGEFGTILDGLFDESGSGDFSGFAWQPKSLPAV